MMTSPKATPADAHYDLTIEGDCVRRFQIHVQTGEVEAEIQGAARKLGRKLSLPGFRKGRVPVPVVRKRYGRELEEEAVRALAARHLGPCLKKEGIEPVVAPQVEEPRYRPGEEMVLSVRVEVQPTFELADYRSIRVPQSDPVVKEEDVERAIESIRQHRARLKPVEDRPAAAGDDVLVDLEGEHVQGPETGKKFRREDLSLPLGSGDFHPDLSHALEGTRAGEEKEIRIRYPNDYRTQALAGRNIHYRLRVKKVRERLVPALDDQLAREVGDFESLDELRRQVRTDLAKEAGTKAARDARRAVIRQLLERNPFQVPPTQVRREVERRLRALAYEMARQGVDPASSGIQWEEESKRLETLAQNDLRADLIMDAIGRRESLEADEKDLEKFFSGEGKRQKKNPAAVRVVWEKEGRMDMLRAHLRREKVLDFLVGSGHIQEEGESL
ncbi:MAG: trigger factor [Acidobacteriota bacterium]